MTTKELIQSEVERMSDEQLAELYAYIQQTLPAPPVQRKGLLQSLQEIQIDLPPDFSMNWKRYVGEWAAEDQDIR